MNSYIELLRRHASPMKPVPTGVAPQLTRLVGLRAVLFDVYGTMFISASGDVGTVAAAPAVAIAEACRAVDLEFKISGADGAAVLVANIEASHAEAHQRGVEHPEVDIVDVWHQTLERLQSIDAIAGEVASVDLEQLSIEFEVRVNPVWPMPGLDECLQQLRSSKLDLGIISNAQFFTPLLFPAILQQSLSELGFAPGLCVMSYLHGQAKPGSYLFEAASKTLASMGVSPGEVLFIGNDMLNDIMPAQRVGFRTALFAGDRRSLRLREDDARIAKTVPDVVVTQLEQIANVLDL